MPSFAGNAWISTIYWDATNNTGLLAYERHLVTMDWSTHETLHETRGCQWVSGLALSGVGAAAITISAGEIHDEDLHHNYTAITDDPILILYRDASLNWTWVDGAAGRLFYVYNAGTSRIRYDNAGTLTDVDNAKFVNYYVFATPFLDETGGGLVTIMGQAQYATASLAAAATIENLSLASLPSLEFKPLWKITLVSGAVVTVQATEDLRSNVSLVGSTIIGANKADMISIVDAGSLYTATNVESALQEVKTTADAATTRLGTLSAFSVDKNDTQAIPTANDTKIVFDDEDYDENSEYDNATNYRFTAKQAGIYHFNASILLSASAWTAGQYAWLALYKGGGNYRILELFEIEANGTYEITLKGSMSIKLAIDDYIEAFVYHNRGSDTNIHNLASYNYFNGHRVI